MCNVNYYSTKVETFFKNARNMNKILKRYPECRKKAVMKNMYRRDVTKRMEEMIWALPAAALSAHTTQGLSRRAGMPISLS